MSLVSPEALRSRPPLSVLKKKKNSLLKDLDLAPCHDARGRGRMVNVSRKPKWERNKCVSSHKTDLSPKNTPTTCLFLDVDYCHPSISAKGKNR